MSQPVTRSQEQFLPERRMMYYLFLLGFFAIFSTTISKNPVLPLFSQAIGANDLIIGLVAAVSPLAGILFSFPVGVLSDHIGRRRLLITSGIVFLSAPLLYLFITEPLWLIPVRFFHGTATAILGPVISAVIAERFPENKGAMLGQYSSATLIGRTIAPLAGGIIISSFMMYPGLIPYRMVYVAAALAAVPVFILTLLYREERSDPIILIPFATFRESFTQFFSNARLRATALVDMATYFTFGAFETFLPLILTSRGISPFLIGIIFAVQVVIIAGTKPFFGTLADRFDKRIQISTGLIILGGSAVCIPFAMDFSMILLVSAAFGLGMSLSTVATSAYVADVAKKEQIGASMGALSSTMDIGHAAGPLVTGIVVMAAGYTYGFFASFLLTVVVTIIFAVSARNTSV
ncbi:MAG: MFS transporter [Methanoregula sp.]|nr:MFS transporter [Methanoregula sp.]